MILAGVTSAELAVSDDALMEKGQFCIVSRLRF
jgi:hypothetical protein